MDKDQIQQRDQVALGGDAPTQENGISATPPPLVLDAGPRDPNLDKHPVPENTPLGVPVTPDTKASAPTNNGSPTTSVNNEGTATSEKQGFADENDVLEYLETTGASDATAGQDKLDVKGIQASYALAKTDQERILKFIDNFKKVGAEKKLPPALLAAIASRESRGGIMLDEKGWGKSDPDGFGIMQVDKKSHEPDENDGPGGLVHIRQAAEVLSGMLEEVKKKFPAWSEAQQLRGAVAAYNFGHDDVQTWEGLDKGTTGNDYSADIWARARYYASLEAFGGSGTVPDAKIPEKQNAAPEERKAVPKGKLIAQSVGKGGVNHPDDVDAILSRMLALKVISAEEAAQKDAIDTYVTRYQGLTMHSKPDGLISPGKKTEQNLINGVLEKPKLDSKGKPALEKEGEKKPSSPATKKEAAYLEKLRNLPPTPEGAEELLSIGDALAAMAFADLCRLKRWDMLWQLRESVGYFNSDWIAREIVDRLTPQELAGLPQQVADILIEDMDDIIGTTDVEAELLQKIRLARAMAKFQSMKNPQKGKDDGPGFKEKTLDMAEYWETQFSGQCDKAAKLIIEKYQADYPELFKEFGKMEGSLTTRKNSLHLVWEKDWEQGTKREMGKQNANDISTLNIDDDEWELAIRYISACLDANVPVMVGVNHTYAYRNASANPDKTTDHWLTVVGKGVENGKRYFSYYDVGTGHESMGVDTKKNRLVETDNAHIWRDETKYANADSGKGSYTLVAVSLYSHHRNKKSFKVGNQEFNRKSL